MFNKSLKGFSSSKKDPEGFSFSIFLVQYNRIFWTFVHLKTRKILFTREDAHALLQLEDKKDGDPSPNTFNN